MIFFFSNTKKLKLFQKKNIQTKILTKPMRGFLISQISTKRIEFLAAYLVLEAFFIFRRFCPWLERASLVK